MEKIKIFQEYIKENYLDEPSNPEILKYDFKKMKKNGYIEVTVENENDEVNKGDVLMVSSSEFGQLPDDSIITCYNKDGEEIMMVKHDLKMKE